MSTQDTIDKLTALFYTDSDTHVNSEEREEQNSVIELAINAIKENETLLTMVKSSEGQLLYTQKLNAELLEALKTISKSQPRTNKKGMIWLNELTALQALANSAIAKAEGKPLNWD